MLDIDPQDLSFERLRQAEASIAEPAWRAAAAHGVDVLLLQRNLALTPAQRLQQLEAALRLVGR
ncbi:MAG: hypothetical protein AAF721_06375 [Myxococcota bacterium]